jgi:hypothetical protein|tara:strand:+ start:1335 stop:1691 length:357 start_codon:yes stop_codon:yes gene_type:complete
MAHFAEIDENNFVLRVIAIDNSELLDDNDIEQEVNGMSFCQSLLGGTWVQTSYNGNMRKNFASAGDTYDSARDAFYAPQPYSSWSLNDNSCLWEAPTPLPDDKGEYIWDEETTSWVQV